MSNIILTNSCNLNCPFCFATETKAKESINVNQMTMEEFREILKFDTNIVTGLCGGEPTTHPNFCEMLNELLSIRGKYVNLLTNGVWPEHVRNFISNLPFEKSKKIIYLFNILKPELYTDEQKERLRLALKSINTETAYIGFTIYKQPFDYSYIFDFAEEFGVTRIRYSIAAPNIMDSKSWNIDPEKDFSSLSDTVYQFIKDAHSKGLEVNPDCGSLPPCAYTKEQLADLLLIKPSIKFNCSAVVDIAPGGKSWRCYGLYSVLKANTKSFSNIKELTDYHNRRSNLLTNIDLYDECKTCEHKQSGLCYGGCLTFHAIKALKKDKNFCLFPIDNDEKLLECVATIDYKKLKRWKNNDGELVLYIRKEGQMQTKTLKYDNDLLEFINLCDGNKTVKEIIYTLKNKYDSYVDTKKYVLEKTRYLFDLDILNIKFSL